MSIKEDGSVEFNEAEQAAVDKIISDRMSRESVRDKNEIIETLKEFGYEGTPAEIKAAVKAQADEFKRQRAADEEQERLESLKDQAKENGTTPQLLDKIAKLEAKLSEIDGERTAIKQTEAQKNAQQERYIEEVKEFSEKYADVDMDKLLKNEDFADFYESANPALPFTSIYEKYTKYATDAQKKAIAKLTSNLDRSTASGREKGDHTGGSYGLNESQIATLEEWNRKNPQMRMTYKEFSERA